MGRKSKFPYAPRANTSFEGLLINSNNQITTIEPNDTTLPKPLASEASAEIDQVDIHDERESKNGNTSNDSKSLDGQLGLLDSMMNNDDDNDVDGNIDTLDDVADESEPLLIETEPYYSSLDQLLTPVEESDVNQIPFPVTTPRLGRFKRLRDFFTPNDRNDLWRKISRAIGFTVPQSIIDAFCSHWTTFSVVSCVLIIIVTLFLYATNNYQLLISLWKRLLCILGILPC